MSNTNTNFSFKLDPWSASSLLQKAIRRGEAELARYAARSLYRYRGKGMWRRLITIVFEDIGIADPALVCETLFLATDKDARAILGGDLALIDDLTGRMAAALKDRSADYLICATLKLPVGQSEWASTQAMAICDQVAIASDTQRPLVRRAAAALQCCTNGSADNKLQDNDALRDLLVALEGSCSPDILQAVELAARKGCDRFLLMAALLGSALPSGEARRTLVDAVPKVEMCGQIPLYTFDKHTSAGKRAITQFAAENGELRNLLSDHAPDRKAVNVALMAAFYADATPISSRLDWAQSRSLEALGLEADMIGAGCSKDGIEPVVDCVRNNLDHLNELRRRVLQGRKGR